MDRGASLAAAAAAAAVAAASAARLTPLLVLLPPPLMLPLLPPGNLVGEWVVDAGTLDVALVDAGGRRRAAFAFEAASGG